MTRSRHPSSDGVDLRRSRVVWLFIVVVATAHVLTIREGHPWGGDFAMYVLHARNLSQGVDYKPSGYVTTDYVPHDFIGPQAYPPVFPLMLAPIYALAGLDLHYMKMLVVLCFAASLWFIYATLRAHDDDGDLALMTVFLVGVCPWIWEFKDDVRSDLPFLMFVYMLLYLVRRSVDAALTWPEQIKWGLAVGLVLYAAYGTRPIGLTLVPAIGLHFLLHARERVPLMAATALVFGAFYVWQRLFLDAVGSLTAPFSTDPELVVRNIVVYAGAFSHFLDNGYSKPIRYAALLLVVALAAVGFASRVRTRVTILELFPFFYLAPLAFYVYVPQIRYLLPILPVVVFWALLGTRRVAAFAGIDARRAALALVPGIMLVSAVLRYTTADYPVLEEGIHRKESVALFRFIESRSSPDDVFVFFKPRVLHLLTGRRAAPYYGFRDMEEFQRYVDHIRADFIIVEHPRLEGTLYGTGPAFVRDFVNRSPESFRSVFSNADFEVFELIESTGR